MTKQEFRQRLAELTAHVDALTDELGDMLPGLPDAQDWIAEYEVPVHIFLYIAQTFAENTEELQTQF